MFDKTLAKTAKTLAISAALLALPTVSSAQTPYFGVSSNVQTLGFPGAFSNYSNGLSLDNYEYRESDPPGAYTGSATKPVWGDAGARGWAQPGELRVKTDATANHLNSTSPPSTDNYGFGEVRFWDSVVVTSNTLPAGTPVTLVFRNDLAVTVTGTGNFSGTFYGTHTIAGRSASLQQSFTNYDLDYSTTLPNITVDTKVGNRFQMSGRAYLHTHARYYSSTSNGVLWDGHAEGELLFKPVIESATGDVYLVADSGASYFPESN